MSMHKGLFGSFGDRSSLAQVRHPDTLDHVVSGPTLTVGVADPWLEVPGRSFVCETDDGCCALWGEAYLPLAGRTEPGRWLLSAYAENGVDALDQLNGSYVVALDHESRGPIVASDIVRSRECYYADVCGERVFGTDPAAVSRLLPDPEVQIEPLAEFLQFGIVLDDRTVFDGLQRLPLDSYLNATGTADLDRFVYRPQSFDYVSELAERLQRALARRGALPGRKGALLSGGYDSRMIVAGIPDIEMAYSVGFSDSSEVQVAGDVARQYGADHRALEPDETYLNTDWEEVQYGHGIMESLHVHHSAYTDRMDVDTIYHGALGDTILRGYFLPLDGIELFDHTCPPYSLDPNPDVAEHFADKFGYHHDCDRFLMDSELPETDGVAFLRRRANEILERWDDRFDSDYDGMALFGVQNQPTRSFRYHLIDHFAESCVAVDRELVEWHLTTPPEHRNTETFLRAIKRLDTDILRHRPPDRPFNSFALNQVRNFLRRKLPLVAAYEGPWPDREHLYAQTDLDRTAFGDAPDVRRLPWRLKLRINDLTTWVEAATDDRRLSPAGLLSNTPTDDRRRGLSD